MGSIVEEPNPATVAQTGSNESLANDVNNEPDSI